MNQLVESMEGTLDGSVHRVVGEVHGACVVDRAQ